MKSGGARASPVTSIVFCAVSATSALDAVAAEPRERLQVGLDAGAAARVGRGDRETPRNGHSTPFAGMNRIRFDGCDLSPDAGHPGPPRLAAPGFLPVVLNGGMAVETAAWDELLATEEIVFQTEQAAREARVVPLPDGLHPKVLAALERRGLTALYAHQADAFEAAARGEHVMVSTGTASGKTLAFNLPVLKALAAEPKQRALYLYPTKALAQDQARSLAALSCRACAPRSTTATPPPERRWQIRKWANVSSPTRTCSTSASCRTTTAGATCSRTSATS